MPNAVRARVASSGVLGASSNIRSKPPGVFITRKTGLRCFDAEGVPDPARERNERFHFSRMILTTNMERHCALQHIKPLVVILVSVKGRLLTRAHQNFGYSDSRLDAFRVIVDVLASRHRPPGRTGDSFQFGLAFLDPFIEYA